MNLNTEFVRMASPLKIIIAYLGHSNLILRFSDPAGQFFPKAPQKKNLSDHVTCYMWSHKLETGKWSAALVLLLGLA